MRCGSRSLREFPRDFELAESNSMIDHVSLAVRDLVASAGACERMPGPRSALCVLWSVPARWASASVIELWLNHRPRQIAIPPDTGAGPRVRASTEDRAGVPCERRWPAENVRDAGAPSAPPSGEYEVFWCLRLRPRWRQGQWSSQLSTRSRAKLLEVRQLRIAKRPPSLGTKCRVLSTSYSRKS